MPNSAGGSRPPTPAGTRSWPPSVKPDGDADPDDEAIASFQVADCSACHGVLKPDVVFFGENVPRPRAEACYALVERSSALVVLGSSLTVMSGFRYVRHAARRQRPIVIVNQGATRGDAYATATLDAPLGQTLTKLVTRIRGPVGSGDDRRRRRFRRGDRGVQLLRRGHRERAAGGGPPGAHPHRPSRPGAKDPDGRRHRGYWGQAAGLRRSRGAHRVAARRPDAVQHLLGAVRARPGRPPGGGGPFAHAVPGRRRGGRPADRARVDHPSERRLAVPLFPRQGGGGAGAARLSASRTPCCGRPSCSAATAS